MHFFRNKNHFTQSQQIATLCGMRCPYCNYSDSRVADSRPDMESGTIRRRRVCNQCGAKFSTVERVQMRDLVVKKNSGKTEPFDRDKLRRSIKLACHNRDVGDEQIERPQRLGVFQLQHALREFGHVLHDAVHRVRIVPVKRELHAVVAEVGCILADPERELDSPVRLVPFFEQGVHVLLEERNVFRVDPLVLEERLTVLVRGPQFAKKVGPGTYSRVEVVVERREAGQLGRVFEILQDTGFFAVGVLSRLQCVFELFPQFGFLLPLLLDGLGTFFQFPIEYLQFPNADPVPDHSDEPRDQNCYCEENQQDMVPEKIHHVETAALQ